MLYRLFNTKLQVFLVHPGGPLFVHKDDGYWSIPKGEVDPHETDFLYTALREFHEETGFEAEPPFVELGYITQKSGKKVHAWSSQYHKDDEPEVHSNLFSMEYPFGSGKIGKFEEVDRGAFFNVPEAMVKIKDRQRELITRLIQKLDYQE